MEALCYYWSEYENIFTWKRGKVTKAGMSLWIFLFTQAIAISKETELNTDELG